MFIMKAHEKCYILAPFAFVDTDFTLPQLPAFCVEHLKALTKYLN
jgi:hypothetical protein